MTATLTRSTDFALETTCFALSSVLATTSFTKKYFALLRLTVANLPHLIQQQMQIFTEEDLLDCLKIDLGLFTTRWHGGRQIIKTGSISFAKMDNTEFEKFFARSVDAILRIYLRGTDRQALIEEVENYK